MRKVLLAATVAAGVTSVLWYRRSFRRWKRAECIARKLSEECATPVTKLWEVADAMETEMRAGLASESGSSLSMLVSVLESLPTGDEDGLFYGVELCHAKIRIWRVQLEGKDASISKKEHVDVPVPINLMVGTSEELYNYIASELHMFISTDNESPDDPIGRRKNVGFAFAFPVIHNPISKQTFVEWNMGFSIKEHAEGDALTLINKALTKHNVMFGASTLVNDSIGTLVGGRYYNSDTVAAVVLGNLTNAAYWEPADAVSKWRGSYHEKGEMVINMEWGNFQSPHLPITEFDVDVDAESPKPGEKIFEKLISGMYLGDIVRRVLFKLAQDTALFGDIVLLRLRVPFSLGTPDVASMHQDSSEDLLVVGEMLEKSFGITNSTLRMREIVVEVCDIIIKRAARLAAAGIVGILKKIGRDGTDKKAVVVVQGELYEHYRLYRNYLIGGVKDMLQGKFLHNVSIEHLSDGSGIGAALLAASYHH